MEADLVLMPYNYLVDPSIRARLNLPLQGAIVIIDEAHNIEGRARTRCARAPLLLRAVASGLGFALRVASCKLRPSAQRARDVVPHCLQACVGRHRPST